MDRFNIKILNLSIGTAESDLNDPLVKAVNAAWNKGIVITAASGNNGPGKCTVTSPGTSKKIITVGASDDNSKVQIWGDTLVNFSGRGPTKECIIKPDVIAPGSRIISALSPDSVLSRDKQKIVDGCYAKLSGTSMSTPVVTGAIALLLEKYPSLTPDEIKLALKETCVNISYPQNQQGWGLLNVNNLLSIDINNIRGVENVDRTNCN